MLDVYDRKISSYLSSYLFDRIFNQPNFEFRKNIIPVFVSTSMGKIRLSHTSIELPIQNELFNSYIITNKSLGGLNLSKFDTWKTLIDLYNETGIEFRVHNTDGVMLPRGNVYIKASKKTSSILLTVKTTICKKLFGKHYKPKDLFIAPYFPNSGQSNQTIRSFEITEETNVMQIHNLATHANVVFVNGRYVQYWIGATDTISEPGTFVELITDDRVLGTVYIDLADADQRRSFISRDRDRSKTIVHIPKSMNPTNKLISAAHCDFYVIARDGSYSWLNGLFLHRAIDDEPITQITHNDFAIPNILLTAYLDYPINFDGLSLRVVVRDVGTNNVLIRDKNYIDQLYANNTDDEILDYLEGKPNKDDMVFEFWSAAHLEDSAYCKALSDTPNSHPNVLQDYVDILGYYEVLNLINKRIFHKTISSSTDQHFKILIPPIWENTSRIYPIVTLNGVRLNDDKFTYSAAESRNLVVYIKDEVSIVAGDKLSVELIDMTVDLTTFIIPDTDNRLVKKRDDHYKLYSFNVLDTPAKGVDSLFNTSFEDLSNDLDTYLEEVELNNNTYLQFKSASYDNAFVVIFEGGYSRHSYDVNEYLNDLDPIVYDLNSKFTNVLLSRSNTFRTASHTSNTSATGTILNPVEFPADPDVTYRQAWHIFSSEDGFDNWENRYIFPKDRAPIDFTYELASAEQNTHQLVGYKVGFLVHNTPGMSYRRANEKDLNQIVNTWEVYVDGVLVSQVTNYNLWGDIQDWATVMLDAPVNVDSEITFRAIDSKDSILIAIPKIEYIFDEVALVNPLPYLGNVSPIVYINNHELVKGIDFDTFTVPDENDHPAGKQVIVQGISQIVNGDNKLHIINTRDVDIDRVGGVTYDGVLDSITDTTIENIYNPVNIGPLGTATSSSVNYGTLAKNAIDGKTLQLASSGSILETKDHRLASGDAWFKVSWPDQKNIGKLVIYTKMPNPEKFIDFLVEILDSDDNVIAEYERTTAIPSTGIIEITDFKSIINNVRTTQSLMYYKANAVRITLLPGSIEATRILALAEVEVYEISEEYLLKEVNPVWFDGMSVATVDGKVKENISTQFGDIIVNEYKSGSLFGLRSTYSLAGKKFLGEYYNTFDIDLLNRIVSYFATNTAIGEDTNVVLEQISRIYSVYLSVIFRDLMAIDDISYSEPAVELLNQLTAEYDFILNFDTAVKPIANPNLEVLLSPVWTRHLNLEPLSHIIDGVTYRWLPYDDVDVANTNSTYFSEGQTVDTESTGSIVTVEQSSTPDPLKNASAAIDSNDTTYSETDNHINPDIKTHEIQATDSVGLGVTLVAGRQYRIEYISGAFRNIALDNPNPLKYVGHLHLFRPSGFYVGNIFTSGPFGDPIQVENDLNGASYTYTATHSGIHRIKYGDATPEDNGGSMFIKITDLTDPIGRAYWRMNFNEKIPVSVIEITPGPNPALLNNYKVYIENSAGVQIAEGAYSPELNADGKIVIDQWDLLDEENLHPTGQSAGYIEGYSIRIELQPYLGMSSRILQLEQVTVRSSALLKRWIVAQSVKLLGDAQLPSVTL